MFCGGCTFEALSTVTRVNDDFRHKLIWGWLRLFLGFAQMSLAALSFGVLIIAGLRPVTWILVVLTMLTTLLSRFLYHGRSDPRLKK